MGHQAVIFESFSRGRSPVIEPAGQRGNCSQVITLLWINQDVYWCKQQLFEIAISLNYLFNLKSGFSLYFVLFCRLLWEPNSGGSIWLFPRLILLCIHTICVTVRNLQVMCSSFQPCWRNQRPVSTWMNTLLLFNGVTWNAALRAAWGTGVTGARSLMNKSLNIS